MLLSVDTVIGNEVHNLQNDDLGKIKSVMLDIPTWKVAYAVLSFGGMFGMGDKLFAVPWKALTLDIVKKCFTLDADKEK